MERIQDVLYPKYVGELSRIDVSNLLPMRVAICMTSPPDSYSGGRYAAVSLAESIGIAGHDVYLVTNNRPLSFNDFAAFPAHDSVQLCLTPDFRSGLPAGVFDIVILVPGGNFRGFYDRVRIFARRRKAHLVLYNFETGDWFNDVSPYARPLEEWKPWRKASRDASLILSISEEGDQWARRFYEADARHARFEFSYPAVNVFAADAAESRPTEKRVLLFMRFWKSQHKGSHNIEELFCDALRDHTLVIVIGFGDVPADLQDRVATLGDRYGINVTYLRRLSDLQKFEEIKRSRLVLFPSLFEGFGYPPVEALYCGTPCVAFELPVLRETCGDSLVFARHDDWEDFRAKTHDALQRNVPGPELRRAVSHVADVNAISHKLDEVLTQVGREPRPKNATNPMSLLGLMLRDQLQSSYLRSLTLLKRFASRIRRILRRLRSLPLRVARKIVRWIQGRGGETH